MSNTSEKYISEAKMSEAPSKKLSLVIANGAVTTSKLADGAITFDKLNVEVTSTIDYLDTTVEALADSKADKSQLQYTSYNNFTKSFTTQPYNGAATTLVTASQVVTDGDGLKGVLVNVGGISGELPKDVHRKVSISIDNTPTENSLNPITSGAVYTALQGKGTYSKPAGGIPSTDLASAVTTSLGKADSAVQDIQAKVGTSTAVSIVNSTTKIATITIDSTPTNNSTNTVTSGGVYTAVNGKYTKPSGGIPMNDLSQSVQDAIAAGGSGIEVIDLSGYMSSTSWQNFHSSQDLCNDVISAYQNGKQVVLTYSGDNIRVAIPIQFPYAQSATGTTVLMMPWSGSGVALSLSGSSISSASNYMYFISGDGNGHIYTQIYTLSPNV